MALPSAIPLIFLGLISIIFVSMASGEDTHSAVPFIALNNPQVSDQDDLCFWKHPSTPSQSLVIVSDKKSNRIFVYDLKGELQQTIEIPKPGNIDIRQRILVGGRVLDVVAVNSRGEQPSLRVFTIDQQNGHLIAIDGGGITTRPNYGGCLAYDSKQEKLWFLCTSESVGVTQYELVFNAQKVFEGNEVRRWELGKCEGAVADDRSRTLWIAVEAEGVWEFRMSPDDPLPGKKIVPLGENGLQADLEGVCLATLPGQVPVFIVSSQGRSEFFVFERKEPWSYRGRFSIQGATLTDGIDLLQSDSIDGFEGGIFGCHTAEIGHPILLTPWSDIVNQLSDDSNK